MSRELGPASRSLLDAARDGVGPDPASIARMRSRIDVAVATAPAVGLAGLAAKLGLVGLVAVVAIGAGMVATRSSETALPTAAFDAKEAQTAPPIAGPKPIGSPIAIPPRVDAPAIAIPQPAASRVDAPAVPQPAAPTPIATAPRVDASVAQTTPRVDPPAIEMEPVRRERNPARTVPAAPHTVDLAREVELVDRAMVALRRGDPTSAVAAVRLHATETSNRGQLAEDAAAIEIEALCKLHDPAAATRLVTFDARWPSSAQRSRLTCH